MAQNIYLSVGGRKYLTSNIEPTAWKLFECFVLRMNMAKKNSIAKRPRTMRPELWKQHLRKT